MSELSDSDLIERVRSGSPDFFADLVNRHQRLVISIVRRAARDYGEIEDLAQEVFIRAYKGLKKFRGEAKFSTWLGQIAFRVAADSLKKRKERIALVILRRLWSPGRHQLSHFCVDGASNPQNAICRISSLSMLVFAVSECERISSSSGVSNGACLVIREGSWSGNAH